MTAIGKNPANGPKGGRMYLAQPTLMNPVVAAGQVHRDPLGLFPWFDGSVPGA